MFEELERFQQREVIDRLKKRLAKDLKLANYTLPFLDTGVTVKQLLEKTKEGWCWGICASIMESLHNPFRGFIHTAEGCTEAFQQGIKVVSEAPIETMMLHKAQHCLPKELAHINPPDMRSPFSMWYVRVNELSSGKAYLHAITTSNRHDLSTYFIFDPNLGLYRSTPRFTKELNDFRHQLLQSTCEANAMKAVIEKAASTFAQLVSSACEDMQLSLSHGIPYIGSNALSGMVRELKTHIEQVLPKGLIKLFKEE